MNCFRVEISAVNKHLKNIYDSRELKENETISKIETVQNEGDRDVTRNTSFYNLDTIILVGYRISHALSPMTTPTLDEYMINGFAIDDEEHK
ncbi:RhuM family protein [Pediococcus ethanolidurans]|uniref:RhuM family protein n=1 Tax=Pediococcus ethanolidurans TaxID=319653 RepID=UPI001C1EABBE|nr:virulence RhuM family protein [Pediococcus ethanolidurans]